MAVDSVRKEVSDRIPLWNKVKDTAGSKVKERGDLYLPRPNAADTSKENKARYEMYLERAVFYNVTGRTLNGLVGQVFQKDLTVDVPELMEVISVDADGSGASLEQHARRTLSRVLSFGRAGLFTDYPSVEGATTRRDLMAGNIRPVILGYDPDCIINWRTRTVGARILLSLVVLSEKYEASDDGFMAEEAEQLRVLGLDEYNQYYVEIYRKVGGQWTLFGERAYPRNGRGQLFQEIPFTFCGSLNNDPEMDDIPLLDLVEINLAHYRNSADYEESCYMVGQPTPWASGLTESWVNDVLKGEFHLGSRAVMPLPPNSSVGIMQASPNTMVKEAMDHKERQMVALGAKLVEQKQVQRTATEAAQEESSEANTLTTAAKNVSAAYQRMLDFCADYMNASGEVSFELSTDLEVTKMTSQERQQLISEWQQKAITTEEMRFNLRRSGVAYEDDESYKEIISDENPEPAPAARPVNTEEGDDDAEEQ